MADEATRRVVSEIPVLKTNAGPRDRELWVQRLKEEYQSLIRVSCASAAYCKRVTGNQGSLEIGSVWKPLPVLKFNSEFIDIGRLWGCVTWGGAMRRKQKRLKLGPRVGARLSG